jgi:hypothetical protein
MLDNGRCEPGTTGHNKIGPPPVSAGEGPFLRASGGAPGRIRTCDTRFRKPMLYPLSYEGLPVDPSCVAGEFLLGPCAAREPLACSGP